MGDKNSSAKGVSIHLSMVHNAWTTRGGLRMKRFVCVVVACAAGCSGLRVTESDPEGPTVLDVLPVVSRGGDIYGNGNRTPLDLSREISAGRVCWKGRYWEQIGQEKKGELRTVRIGSDGKETVLESETIDKPICPKLWDSHFRQFLKLSGRPSASSRRASTSRSSRTTASTSPLRPSSPASS